MEYCLYHHGIRGMKWGVRRTAEQLGRAAKSTVKGVAKAVGAFQNRRSNYKATDSKRISDAELSKRIKRLQQEEMYTRLLSNVNENHKSRGKKLVRSILEDGTRSFARKGVDSLGDKVFGKTDDKKKDDDAEHSNGLRSGNYLCHHGVKGMRWGVINNDKSSGAAKTKYGVSKTAYKSMNREQRKQTRSDYWKSDAGVKKKAAIKKTAAIAGSVLAASAVAAVGAVHISKMNKRKRERAARLAEEILANSFGGGSSRGGGMGRKF